MLQHVYDSAWHLPAVAFLSVTVLFIALARRLPFIVGYSVLFAWLIIIDAWGNGALSPIPPNGRTLFEIVFIVLGDWRYFVLLERYWHKGMTPGSWARSLALACLVPAISLSVILASHGKADMRVVFLVYEIAFFILALLALFVVLPKLCDIPNRAFLRSITEFELLQYGLWAVGDLLLAGGQSWAMTLRLTGNIFYYSLFVPFVWWRSADSPTQRKSIAPVAALGFAAFALSFVGVGTNRAAATAPAAEPAAELSFTEGGKHLSTLSLTKIIHSLPVEEISAFDPYYQHNKRWRAVSVENILASGFNRDAHSLAGEEFVMRAADGFAAYFPGGRLLEGGAYIAIADLDVADWEPIGPRKDNPAPFYVIWAKSNQQDLETHARPWQLASIEIVSFDSQFPHVRPEGVTVNSSAGLGFQTFRVQCLPCHAINRAGGNVGPELNVPRNILEYRDPGVVRAFIKNPLAFRYTVMPAHPNMTQDELDGVIAYLKTMKDQKHDKGH